MPTSEFVRVPPRERLLPVLLAAGIAAAAPGAAEWVIGSHEVYLSANVHFFAVGLTALAAAAAAVALTLAGAHFKDTRAVIVGTAFGVMAALLALHGLSTPGVIFGRNGVVTFTGGATLPAGGALLTLATAPVPTFLRDFKKLLVLDGVLLAVVIGLGISGILFPSLLPPVPKPNGTAALTTLTVGLLAFALLTMRALRTFLLTHRISDVLVAVGIVWLGTSLVAALTMNYTELGWWLGHALELDGILLVGIPVAVDLARTAQSRPLAGDLHAADLVISEEAYLGSHVRSLTLSLAQRDDYTEQHTRRVALRAVQVGEELGISTNRLRTLAIGGLIHDIGKLSVPDSILKKPGPLDDDEYAVIKRHPELGNKLLDELGGFSEAVRRLVHDHHERLDGRGYPRGLGAGEIGLDTRILSVCDVYDALVSSRVYRPAWSHDEAIALLRGESGSAFDARCVRALETVLRRERGEAEEREPAVIAAPVAAVG